MLYGHSPCYYLVYGTKSQLLYGLWNRVTEKYVMGLCAAYLSSPRPPLRGSPLLVFSQYIIGL